MLSLPDHLTQIVTLLRSLVDRILSPGHAPVAQGPSLHMLLSNRLGTAMRGIARLYALWRENRLPPPRAPRPRRPDPTPAATPPRPRLSRARAWLLRRGGQPVAVIRAQLEAWLARPDLPDFIAAVPRAGRHLRPLCHMLGADLPPALRLPPRAPRRRPPRPPAPRRPALDSFDPPLADNIIAAGRAWRERRR